MSAHRRVRRTRNVVRRTVSATVLTLVSAAGFVALAEPAHAAGPWFVKTAALGGNNANTCLSSAQACATITGVLAKPGFVNGDTINVAAGQYNERPVFTNKGANIVGEGSGASALTNTIISNNNVANSSTFNVQGAVTVSLANLRVTAGTGTGGIGGGIRVGNSGNVATTVNTTNVVIDNNKAVLGAGVAVFAGATYNANNTGISNNVASGANAAGGGVYNAATMTMQGGGVTGNSAPLGGGVVNGGSATLVLTTITGNAGTTQGGGFYNGAALQLTNTTITGNTSPLGAGIYNAGGAATVGTAAVGSGGQINSNTASNVGGGAYVAAGTLTINKAVMSSNTATNGGGAVGVVGGTANLNGVGISTSTGTFGGALYNAATMNVTSSTVVSSQALQGGAAYNNTGGTLTLNSSTFTGNSTTGAVGSTQGGGIVNVANLVLNDSAVNNNTTGNQGGGISSNGTVTMNGGSVNGNNAVTGAGIVNAGTFTATNGSVSNNTAVNGGALYNTAAATFDGTALSGNTANGGTTANGGNAGAIYNANAVTLKNATLTGNKVVANTNGSPGITGYGGAILNVTFSASITPAVTLTDTAINGGNVSGGNAVIGGAIASYPTTVGGSTGTVTGTRLTLSKNVAAAAGGVFSPGALTLIGSTVDQNRATHASAGNAGGIYAGGAPVVLDDTDVTGNVAVAGGGGAYLAAGSTSEIRNGSTFSGNTAASGAAIYNASTLAVKNSSVDGNNASYAGAGLFTGGATTLTDSTFLDNSAAAFGGAILTAGAPLTATGGEISGNDAFAGGGVIIGASTPVSFDGTDFEDNTSTGASSGGGAILSAGNLTVKNATLSGNTADGASGYGGAIYSGSTDSNVNTSLKVENSTLTGNEAFGAAAIVAGSSGANTTNKTSVLNSTITGNASASAVGALQLYHGSTITGSTITDNTAGGAASQNVGGIVAAAGVVGVSGSVVSGNTGKQCFAAVADGGYNLTSVGEASCGFSAGKNDVFAPHGLAPLAANGGQTETRLPSAASAALDRIPANTATGVSDAITGAAVALCAGGTDQRGTARPQGAKCDIGAVEKVQVAPTVSGPANADTSVGNAMAPLTYTSTGSPQPTLSATGLPNGVTLTDNGDGTATISGTPAAGAGGSYTVVVKATNEAGSATTELALVVRQAPTISGPATATYTTGQAGGPTTFSQTSGFPQALFTSVGSLPGGVGFADNGNGSGSYSGTPAAGTGGVYDLTVKASNGTAPDATAPFTLTVNEAAGLTGPSTATFQVGTAGASGEFVGTGFPVPALTSDPLPGGLSLTSTGSGKAKITGTPGNGTGGVHHATVTASNGVAADATQDIAITVNEAPELTGPVVARFVAGSPNSVGFSSDGYPVAALTRTGTLPAGLSFVDNGNGSATLSGTAPASAIGTYTITVKAGNGIDPEATQQVTIQVVPPLAISSTTLVDAAYRTTYSAQIVATGGQPAYTFSLQSGALPAGLTLSPSGLVTGSTTAAPGTYTFTVKATDTADPAQSATKQLTIKVVKGATVLKTTPILLRTAPNGDITINIALFEADLKGGFPLQPIAGETVKFRSGSTNVCSAKTDADGHVKCQPDLLTAILVPLKGTITATYAGNTYWNPSSSSAGLIGN